MMTIGSINGLPFFRAQVSACMPPPRSLPKKRLKKAFKMGLNALHDAGGAEGVKMYLERHSIPYLAKDENLVTVETGRGRQLVHAAE